ncbi:MAG: hypothetical protein OIF58_05245 [Cohaesibacter sp.]|nr:hypothetical protein [Cohaesibacter sp.]
MIPENDKYLVHLKHLDLPHDKKLDLIQTVRNIFQNAIDRHFGEDPVQTVLELKAEKRAIKP